MSTENDDAIAQLDLTLDQMGKAIAERKADEDLEVAKEAGKEIDAPKKNKRSSRGRPSNNIIKQAELALIERERRGDFEQFPIHPSSEFPTLLTRIPIFIAGKRSIARQKIDEDMAVSFETGWGRGRKFGPPLNVYDEDTLLALGALRQRRLIGRGDRMPSPTINPMNPDDESKVDVVYTTVTEIQRYLGLSTGGRALSKRLKSVERLAAIVIELTKVADKSMQAVIQQRKFRTKLIDLLQEDGLNDSYLFVQFPPVMVAWLENSYTYIDMDIRKQLNSDTGKLIHKFLASQGTFNIGLTKLAEVVGSEPNANFNRTAKKTFERLAELGWLDYTLEGTGRTKPYVVKGRVLQKKAKA